MRAAVSLLRNRFGSARMHAKALPWDQLKINASESIISSGLDEFDIPKGRFIQYMRSGNATKRLGMVSENGSKMIELSSRTCASPDMVQFIQQRYCMSSLLDSIQFMDVDNVSPDLILLPPIHSPGKIIGVSCNYYDSCSERRECVPKEPVFFVKFNTAITGAMDNIRAHQIAKRIDYGCELAVVIGKKCRHVSREAAMSCVFGYMIAQDITARDWNVLLGGQTLLGKSLDTFCPLGPVLVHKCHVPDVDNLWITTIVNGEERQSGNTENMIFKIDYLINRLSQFMTLCPGDIILTGTPAGTGAYRHPSSYLKPGDLVESEIQKLGKLRNKVVNPYA
ncbi:fumarylacetoacetate hydrolase domain-containing protein 2 [Drosophila grimshawi]|uniref:GH20953 n=1 Tax=Drosophila grimshawi TaxID=7222 RepID=B4JRL1_DROGR|nr:fumarylacetoacetate hydrolase domain-containing protein 2 [Drosophila grimshawi]EDV94401.1 GH20953 [Drosophila grimshawi]